MNITVRKGHLINESADAVIIGVFSGAKKEIFFDTELGELDAYVRQVLKEEKFRTKEGATLLLRMEGRIAAKRILFIGLGNREECDVDVMRRCSAQALCALRPISPKVVLSTVFGLGREDIDVTDAVRAMVEGVRLSGYRFGRYKKAEKGNVIQSFVLIVDDARLLRRVQAGIELAEITASATIVARDLVNTPAVHLAPKDLVDAAKQIVKGKGDLRMKVFDKERLKRMGAGGILAVNQGSDHDPFMVHLVYKPKKKAKKILAIVGKAVTFDSGGLSIKPADGMMDMKIDMSGAAAVLGVFSALSLLKPNVEVHGIFGAVENMPSGKAIRPGDIVTAMNGKTIEILNTDAEGRVTLADTLTYACKQKPDMVIDIATLTGACMVALGEEITGLMSNNPELAQRVLMSAKKAGEQMWELPLYKGYRPLIQSDLADVKNIGGRYGGALTAGLFLQEFVEKDLAWVHLDIAGPASNDRPRNAYEQKGATGHPVRTLIEFLRSF